MEKNKQVIGWREWVELPELGIKFIKAKLDTGARTSALHAFNIVKLKTNKIKFDINPMQRNKNYILHCKADLLEQRYIKNSGGSIEYRCIIKTLLKMANQLWPIELTLTDRENMGFKLLLGRTAILHNFLINPNKSFLLKNK